MHVLLWGTYDTGKPRVRLLLRGLALAGAEVSECQVNVWGDVRDKSLLRGTRHRLRIALRWLFAYPPLIWRLARAPHPDVLLVSYPGVLDMLVAAPIARFRGIPLAWDMFMSIYDTVVEDRQLLARGSVFARLLRALEGFALRRADLVFLDTQAHARRVECLFGLTDGSVGAVWVGVETEHFPNAPSTVARQSLVDTHSPLKVLFYGQFIPLHGIETIVQAARITRDEPIEWQLIGNGQEAARIEALLAEQPLPNLRWERWVDYAQLHERLAEADVCLGIFGQSEKAARVIPNKVFQIIAMGRPLITRDSPAIREMLSDVPPCVHLVPPADAQALADAVRDLVRRGRVASPCHATLRNRIDAQAIGRQCKLLLTNRFGLES